VLDAILMERAGVPAIAIVTEPFRPTGEAMTAAWGMAGYAFLATPHPIANLADPELDERADRLLEAVQTLLKR
jgi:acetyl-CoA carboxylase beta subunit